MTNANPAPLAASEYADQFACARAGHHEHVRCGGGGCDRVAHLPSPRAPGNRYSDAQKAQIKASAASIGWAWAGDRWLCSTHTAVVS
jgi:hypothetical protein